MKKPYKPTKKEKEQHDFLGDIATCLGVGCLIAAAALQSVIPVIVGVVAFVLVVAYSNNLA